METPQLAVAVLFLACLLAFLVWKRKKISLEWILYPVVYFAMYRSSWGLGAMDRIAERWRPALRALGVVAVGLGFLGMGLISYQLVKNIAGILLREPGAATVGIVQPFAQNVPGTIFVPFVYFAISIFVIAVLHEFSHGVMARVHKCRVRSSGFAFVGVLLPIIPAAFVEPDEKEMSKSSPASQMAILASGAVSNILLALVLLALIVYAVQPMTESLINPLGVEVVSVTKGAPADSAGLKQGDLVTSFAGMPVKDSKGLLEALAMKRPGDAVEILASGEARTAVLSENPSKPGKAHFGVQVTNKFEIKDSVKGQFGSALPQSVLWFAGLVFWLFNLSLGIGLFNLVPLGPVDGGKLFSLGLSSWFEQETAHRIWKVTSILFLTAILINLGGAFFA